MSCGRSVAYCCWLLCFAVIGVYNQYMPTMQCMQALESIWNCNDHFASIVRLFDCGIGGNSSTITIVLIFVFVFFSATSKTNNMLRSEQWRFCCECKKLMMKSMSTMDCDLQSFQNVVDDQEILRQNVLFNAAASRFAATLNIFLRCQ